MRDAALAVPFTRPAGELVLDVVFDSALPDQPVRSDGRTVHGRLLVFGTGPVVSVFATYGEPLTHLSVQFSVPGVIAVEVLSPTPRLRLAVEGSSPLTLRTSGQGPASLLIRLRERPTSQPESASWRTAWLVL